MLEFDLVVLGAGAAGMMGAMAAAHGGRRVLLVEPFMDQANNLAISGGLFPAAGSALQSQAGVSDRPAQWLADLRSFAGDSVNERIAVPVAQALPEMVDFLIGRLHAPIGFLPDVVSTGHSQCRFHSTLPAGGAALHHWFRQQIHAHPLITLQLHAVNPQRGPQGFVLDVENQRVRAPHVLLAGGGFGANPAWVAQHIPAMRGALYNGAAHSDGSAIAWGLDWGGQLWGMDGFQGQGHTNPGGLTRLGMGIPALGGILVNRQGKRFVREDIGPSALAPWVMAQPQGLALEVFDAHIESGLAQHAAYQSALQAGQVLRADDVPGLATLAGVDAQGLQATLREVQAMAQGGGATDPLGRTHFARVLKGPWLASWVTGALSHTQGGLVTDGDGRVLDAQGQWINGVWAAGGSAAGLSGRGADGYLPGNGLAQSFGLAWRMAQALGGAGV
jgi:fumarate reductase flavoprotein subunit